MLVFDTSGSMLATDVQPSRLAAAQARGQRRSRTRSRTTFRIGVDRLRLQRPAAGRADDRPRAREDDDQLAAGRGRDRDGRRAQARDQLGAGARCRTASAARAGCRRRSSCSATARARAATDPIDVVQDTKKFKIPVYTVALGTQNGTLTHTDPNTGATNTERVPPDLLTLQDIARDTGGQFFATADAQPARSRLPQPRHAADQDQGEAAGDVGLRRRRARAAAGRRRLRPRARREAPVSRPCGSSRPRPSARRTKPGPGPVPPAVLRSLDLAVMKRIESLCPAST